jgi:hypothetical protein
MNWDKSIFLAHAVEDKQYVRTLYRTLKENGLEPWLDEENLLPGAKWDDNIKEAIHKSRFFLACLSKNSISKNGYVQKELKVALSELEKKAPNVIYFLPALIDDVELPDISVGTINLKDYHAVKLFEDFGFSRLLDFLKKETNIYDEIKKEESSDFQIIRNCIAEGEIESSLRMLMEYVKNKDEELLNNVVLLSSRFSNLKNDNILGLISQERYSIENNRVVYSILETIKLLEKR